MSKPPATSHFPRRKPASFRSWLPPKGVRWPRSTTILLGLGLVLGLPAALPAQSLQAQISSNEAFVGESLEIQISVSNMDAQVALIPPSTQDFDIQADPGNPVGSSQRMSIINGRRTDRIDYTYRFFVRPLRIGRLILPPFTAQHRGQTYNSQPIAIQVGQNTTSNLLACEIKSEINTAYVGQTVRLTLEVSIRAYSQAGIGTLDANSMWQTLRDMRASTLGVFDKANWDRPSCREQNKPDDQGIPQKYFVFILETTVQPNKTGPFDFGDVAIASNYPKRLGRGFFGLELQDSRRIRVAAVTPPLTIMPLPAEGRPADFNGAFGRHAISAFAKPTEVPVGDPITLTLEIAGESNLEQLLPPKLNQIEELNRDFEVSGDSLAGEIKGGQKIFAATIRPKLEEVAEIPPIPFSYFDPRTGKYCSVRTEAIPIKVKPAERIALSPLSPGGGFAPALAPLVELSEGLLANESDPDKLLARDYGASGKGTSVLLATMPVLYLLTWFIQRRVLRLRDDVTWRRRNRAYASAKKSLQTHGGNPAPGQVRAAVVGYIADRCGVPGGGLTRAEIAKLLHERGIESEIAREVDSLLESVELAEYGGSGDSAAREAAASARTILARLEKCKLA